jgi:hypothetical protein
MDNDPITKKDLLELEEKLEAKLEQKLNEKLQAFKLEIVEAIRDVQTEVLRGFHGFQTGWTLRLRKIEADQSNLNTASTERLNNLEERVFEIEKKLLNGGN